LKLLTKAPGSSRTALHGRLDELVTHLNANNIC
jgi:hypothetical protein